ncbi:MAG: hypothetical protein COX57_09535 [Alphaproteobacteria bacterium CG_4_10_14_0_2_um_filter_63_37]|nr:MAG: hypothetical protein COX57_09535 [Alphaproteobacteria bacterium CG_4_10_14_0_2_um_filter_63_37]
MPRCVRLVTNSIPLWEAHMDTEHLLEELDTEPLLGSASHGALARILRLAPMGVALLDDEARFDYLNPHLCRMLGYAEEDLLGTPLNEIMDPEHREAQEGEFAQAVELGKPLKGEWSLLNLRGEVVVAQFQALPLPWDGEDPGWVVSLINVTRMKRAEMQVKELATHDPLTGLLNRTTGLAALDQQLKLERRRQTGPMTLGYLDVVGVKQVNETYGHGEGDRLILNVCRVVQEAIRDSDTFCRLGGDEFLLLFPDCSLPCAQGTLARIRTALERFTQEQKLPFPADLHIGLVEYPSAGDLLLDEWVAQADAAMNRERHSRSDQVAS